ncbi:TlpA disulfide reductase family protein [Massilibacteroides sp.]|uniref:TlpA disulfide reductase family protein n=1 Tax=Massilibacteroides sp. TaxID=2034766 RepID=UPI00261A5C61|nr:TlpA disulfide reductase family protein [Massilibacteroides sp.]MDD4516098.1 TlpA disulfide reductase family protein [Massilibacteroides sp.]
MKHLSSLLFVLFGILCMLLTACGDSTNFTVKGVISGGDKQMLYLENVGISNVTLLDSIKLTNTGKFKFKSPKPDYPDFYRLRLNNQLINFSIDSTEVVSFVADAGTFATSYSVEGSENAKAIKSITLAQLDANVEINKLRKEYEAELIEDSVYKDKVIETAKAYKEVARKYIYGAPMSTAAYFALFQQVDGLLFFDLYDKDDSKAYSAVATSYDHYYPNSARTKHLYNLALQSIKVIRSQRQIDFDDIETKEVNFIDIELPNLKGEKVKLATVATGSSVIVNFTAYQTEWSPSLNMLLGELYEKYSNKGLKIYQISLDTDEHLWMNVSSKLPWTCVRDPQNVYSQAAAIYNVKQLPALFLLDKKGNLVKRIEDIKTLEADLKAVL